MKTKWRRSGMAAAVAAAVVLAGCVGEVVQSPPPGAARKIIGARVMIKADKADVFVEEARAIVAASRAEPGCISYTLYRDPHNPQAFFFFEEWKDQAAIDAHFAAPHFKAFGEKLKDLTDGSPVITIYDSPAAKTL